MNIAKVDKDKWIRCAECRHKLGKAIGVWPVEQAMPAIEVKCGVCKKINYIMLGGTEDGRK